MKISRRHLMAGLGAGGAALWATPLSARVGFDPGKRAFRIATGRQVAPIHVDANDYPGVLRAAGDLAQDIGRVCGRDGRVTHDTAGFERPPIIVGALGRSEVIDRLGREGKLDVAEIRGQWEAYTLQTVRQPFPGVSEALVIAGSDKRGTIYGIYDLSENIGVSPWYWWADVPVARRDVITASTCKDRQRSNIAAYSSTMSSPA